MVKSDTVPVPAGTSRSTASPRPPGARRRCALAAAALVLAAASAGASARELEPGWALVGGGLPACAFARAVDDGDIEPTLWLSVGGEYVEGDTASGIEDGHGAWVHVNRATRLGPCADPAGPELAAAMPEGDRAARRGYAPIGPEAWDEVQARAQYRADWTNDPAFVADGGATDAYRAVVERGSHYGTSMKKTFDGGVREMRVRYRVLLPADIGSKWASVSNLKLPGLTGDVSAENGGYGGSRSSVHGQRDRAWSARQQGHRPGTRYTEYAMGTELYHADSTNAPYGETRWYSGDGSIGASLALVPGQWHEVMLHVRMNAPGRSDGFIRTYLDGVDGYHREGLAWSDNEDFLDVRHFWFNVYHGGPKPNPNPDFGLFFRAFEYEILD